MELLHIVLALAAGAIAFKLFWPKPGKRVDLLPADGRSGLVPITKELVNNCVDVLCTAFAEDPTMADIVPDAEERKKFTRWWMRLTIESHAELRGSYALLASSPDEQMSPTNKVVGVLVSEPLGTYVTFPTLLSRVWVFPFMFGIRATFRGVQFILYVDKHKDKVMEAAHNNYFYLDTLGVAVQRKGLGTNLVAAYLKHIVDAYPNRKHGTACLWTSKSENVAFYQKLGFVVNHKGPVGSTTQWFMVREPKL